MTVEEIVKQLKKLRNPKNIAGMARFGITPKTTVLGVNIPVLRTLAKDIKRNFSDAKTAHTLALELWKTKIHEARLLAVFIETPKEVTEKQMEEWVKGFDSWDICDQATTGLFDQTPLAYTKAIEWSKRDKEFQKRAGFALMAGLAVHDKKAVDKDFYPFLEAIKKEANDDRNYVKKAVNWALRNIGKFRNKNLYKLALQTAIEIKNFDSKSARWITSDAIRELNSSSVKKRVENFSR